LAERVFLGLDGGEYKFRVSKPGFDARTATKDQLMIATDLGQIVQATAYGTIAIDENSMSVYVPYTSYGSIPYIFHRTAAPGDHELLYPSYNTYLRDVSLTQFRFKNNNDHGVIVHYFIWNIAAP
jgi:hypothetical protein